MNRRLLKTLERVRAKAAPPPKLKISAWADRFLYLPSESASEPGKFYCDRFPWEREVLDAPLDSAVADIILRWGKQLGKSQILQAVAAYFAHWEPSPVILKLPSKVAAEQNSRERLDPLIKATPVLRALMGDARGRNSDQTILLKKYPGGFWACIGANSSTDLRRRPARVILQDEVDDDEVDVNNQGDPIALADGRAETFSNSVHIKASTPTIVGSSRIDALFAQTDQCHWFSPCPKCGTFQTLARETHLKWNPRDIREAWLECNNPVCRAQLDDSQRIAAVYSGRWQATAPFAGRRGYALGGIHRLIGLKKNHVSFLHEFVDQWIEADRSEETRKVFINNFDGLSYEAKTEKIEPDILVNRAEAYGPDSMPNGVLVLTAGLDVQPDRLEVEITGIGLGEESWGVAYGVFPGDPLQQDVWDRADGFIDTERTCADGRKLKVVCIGVDSGHANDSAYSYVLRRRRGAYALKGVGGFGLPLVSLPRKSSVTKVKLWLVGSDTMKALIYSRLNLKQPGPGFCHFPISPEFGADYFAGLTAEIVVTKWQAGREVKVFENPKRRRNEPLDTRQYSIAALRIHRPNLERLAKAAAARAAEEKSDVAKTDPPKDVSSISNDSVANSAQHQPATAAAPAKPSGIVRLPKSGWMKF